MGGLRKKFDDMEINLEEAILQTAGNGANGANGAENRSLDARMRKYRHKKTNSEVESLCKNETE